MFSALVPNRFASHSPAWWGLLVLPLLLVGCGTAVTDASGDVVDLDGVDVTDIDAAGLDTAGLDVPGLDTASVDAPAPDADAADTDVAMPDATTADSDGPDSDALDAADDASDADDANDAGVDAGEDVAQDAVEPEDTAAPDAAAPDDAAQDAAEDVAVDVYTGCTSAEGCDDADPWTTDACGADGLCTHAPQSSYEVGLATGPAAGAKVVVPVGAIAPGVVLTVAEGTTVDNPGAVAAGPAVQFGPGGTQFLAPVTVVIPYDPMAVTAETDVVVLRREDDTFEITALTPTGLVGGLASVQTSTFSTFQVYVVPKPKVLTFTADKASLPSLGGAVQLTIALQNAQSTALTALPAAGVSVPMVTPTTTTATVQLPGNPDPAQKKTYTLTLTAKGAIGAVPAVASVLIDVDPNPKETYTKVVSGWSHFLALTPEGHVVCWGGNTVGQCQVPAGLKDVKDIAASATASVAVKADGTVVQWGDVGTPYSALPTGGVASVAGGETHFLAAMTDGTVQSWTSYDQWGSATVPAGLTDVVAVAAGDTFSLALKKDGSIAYWGSTVAQGAGALTNVKSIAAGRATALVIQNDGQASFFGYQGGGAYPPPSPAALADTKAVATSNRTSCVLKNDGTLLMWSTDSLYKLVAGPPGDSGFTTVAAGSHYCVGLNADGSIASHQMTGAASANMPFAALGLTDVVAIDIGPPKYYSASMETSHTLALRANGTVVAWSNTGTDACAATVVPDGLSDVIAVASGAEHSLALKKDGTVIGWGCGAAAIVPADVTGVTAIAAGAEFSIAVRADGSVSVWGAGGYTDMWDPLISTNPPPNALFCGQKPCPGVVQPTNVKAISAGTNAGLALLGDGTLSVWGKFFVNPASAPDGLSDVVAVDGSGTNAIALKKDGTIALWGLSPMIPGDIPPQQVTDAIAVAVGSFWTIDSSSYPAAGAQWYALRKDGTLYAAGRNLMGTTDAAKMVTGAVALTAGEWEGAVVRFDGTVQAWGMMAIGAH